MAAMVRDPQPATGETFSIAKKSTDPVISPTGHQDWSTFTAWDVKESKGKIEALPIRALKGDHWSANKGFGITHIQAEHADEIEAMNQDLAKFVHHVLLDFNEVFEDGDRLSLVASRPRSVAIVELRKESGGFYSVITAFPKENPSWKPRGVRILGGRKAAFAQSVSAPALTAQGSVEPKPPLEPLAGKDSWEYFASLRQPVKPQTHSIARADSPLLKAIDALVVAPEKKAEVYQKMAAKVREIRQRFDKKRLTSSLMDLLDEADPDARHEALRDIATLEVIAKTLPPAIRGKLVGSFRQLDSLKSAKGREDYLIRLLPKIEQALENQVAEEMGNIVAMLHRHYHNPQPEQSGLEWFSLRPGDWENPANRRSLAGNAPRDPILIR